MVVFFMEFSVLNSTFADVYVRAHLRSDPDGNPYNSWSYLGNINPYTGKVATGNPFTYLKDYYTAGSKTIEIADSSEGFLRKAGNILNKLWKGEIGIRGPLGKRKIERRVEPNYPEWAEKQRINGKVEVKFWVLSSGEVNEVVIWRTSGWPELDECAYRALIKWRFESIEGEEKQWGIVTFVMEGTDRSYLEVIRTRALALMPIRGEKSMIGSFLEATLGKKTYSRPLSFPGLEREERLPSSEVFLKEREQIPPIAFIEPRLSPEDFIREAEAKELTGEKGIKRKGEFDYSALMEKERSTFQNEPDGFRGLKWGDPPSEDMEYCRFLDSDFDITTYERWKDEMQIGGAELDDINYSFYKGRFMAVEIEPGYDNYDALKDVVMLKFGDGTVIKKDLYNEKIVWSGDLATIILEKSIDKRIWQLLIYSTETWEEKEKEFSGKKEEAERKKEEERQKAAEEGLDDF